MHMVNRIRITSYVSPLTISICIQMYRNYQHMNEESNVTIEII